MNTCAAVQLHRVVLVSLPARLTDAVVNGDVDGGVELQRENVGGREWLNRLKTAAVRMQNSIRRVTSVGFSGLSEPLPTTATAPRTGHLATHRTRSFFILHSSRALRSAPL